MALFAERKERILLAGSIVFLIALAYWILFGPFNAIHYYKVVRELDEVKRENSELASHNEMLREEIEKLTNDPAYLEEVGRKKFGLLKKNEIVFDFSKKK